ncbi:MAG: hypothetical protein OEN23_20825 [Paracoccaceae bacterium]|nr:hypothetical protein [Paracoccaceae bacterium]
MLAAALFAGASLAVLHPPIPAYATGIEAPTTVDPAESVTVRVPSAPSGGTLELWGPVTTASRGARLEAFPIVGGNATIMAPDQPGSYELRYITPAGKVGDRTAFDVAASPIFLSAPQGIGTGIEAPIHWRGPAESGDTIQIFDPAAGTVLAEAPATGARGALNIVRLPGPDRVGTYELRYWSARRNMALRRLTVSLSESDGWLRAPLEVTVGETFQAEWKGPMGGSLAYRITDSNSSMVLAEAPATGTGPVRLKAPARAGAYRMQFVNLETGSVIADLPLDVDDD